MDDLVLARLEHRPADLSKRLARSERPAAPQASVVAPTPVDLRAAYPAGLEASEPSDPAAVIQLGAEQRAAMARDTAAGNDGAR